MTINRKLIITSMGLVALPIIVIMAFYAEAAPSESSTTVTALEVLSQAESSRLDTVDKNPNLYPSLIRVAFSEAHSVPMRWKALTLASRIKKEEALPDLEKALSHKEWFLRNAALLAMKEISAVKGQEAAIRLINDKALVIRSAAVKVIENDNQPEVRKLLWSELNHSYNFRKNQSLWVRSEIVSKLAQNPNSNEMDSFVKALRDNDERLHQPAISALEKVTQRKLGSAKNSVRELRNLWLDWSHKNGITL